MANNCWYQYSIQKERLLFNRRYEHYSNERDIIQISYWSEYFLAQKILIVDEENGWADQEDENDDDDQWEDDDKMEDDDW